MGLRSLVLVAAAAAAITGPASAQYVQGFYVGAGLGLNVLQDIDLSFNSAAGGGAGQANMNLGGAGVVSVGYGYGNGLRAELEGGIRANDADRFGGFGGVANGANASGTVTQYSAMLNVLWDRDFGWPVVPYIGAGIGYAWTKFDNLRAGTLRSTDGDKGNFAYQFMLGLGLPIDAVPGLLVTAEYRFFSTLGDDVDAKNSAGTRVGSSNYDDLRNHSILLGLRYAFSPLTGAAVAAPVAAAPAAARTYLVFFDFNRADLTDRARAVISEAATAAPQVGTTRIEVSGHTDTVGPAGYNQALSMRRAEAVAGELERRGIPRSQMVLQAFGFTRLLVPTGPNVREPQNRRVEIVLR
jgi:opacity protein-like surface antigen